MLKLLKPRQSEEKIDPPKATHPATKLAYRRGISVIAARAIWRKEDKGK